MNVCIIRLIFILFMIIFLLSCSPECQRNIIDKTTYELVQLDNRSKTLENGSLIVCIGSYLKDENIHYRFYIKNTNGEITLKDIGYESVSFFYSKERKVVLDKYFCQSCYHWNIYILEGDIKNVVNMNLEGTK